MSRSRVIIDTPLTRRLGIDVPVIQAGMSWASSAVALPAAVSQAGGLGVLAAGPMRLDDLAGAVETLQATLEQPFAVNLPLYRRQADEVIELLLAHPPPVLIASQGGPKRYLERFHRAGTLCLHVVASVEHAEKAAAAGVDGLVVVGGEAGGHPSPAGVSTLVLVRAVAKAVPGVPLVASGGFADGAGLLAALALGADAAQFGTRFLMSREANVHEAYQRAVLAAGVEDTRTVGRDLGVVRVLRNRFTERMGELERAGADVERRRELFTDATLRMAAQQGDVTDGKVECGQSAGLIDMILPAAEIVASIVSEYETALHALPATLPPVLRHSRQVTL